jgi:hypothetical protein
VLKSLKQVRDLVDSTGADRLLMSEALGEFSAVALALCFEVEQITYPDTAIAADTVVHDFTSIQKFVQMRAAHSESLGSLAWCQRRGTVDHGKVGTVANAAADAEENVPQFRADTAGEDVRFQRFNLVNGDVRGLDGLHAAYPEMS